MRILSALAVLYCLGCAPASSNAQPAAQPTAKAAAQAEPHLDYVEVVTAGAKPTDRLPLIIAIHGLGDRPEHFVRWLKDLPFPARIIAPRAPKKHGRGFSWFPVTIPYDPEAPQRVAEMRRSTERLAKLIPHLTKTLPTQGKVIVTGFSQGGMLSYALAVQHPALIAGAVPISGGLPSALLPKKGATQGPPVHGFHGTADRIVPLKSATATIKTLNHAQRTVTLETFKGVGHTISPAMRQRIFERLIGLTE